MARKKESALLKHHGFDVLGQSLGIPSRADFERKAQSNGVIMRPRAKIASSTPNSRVVELDSTVDECQTDASATKSKRKGQKSLSPRLSSIRRFLFGPSSRHETVEPQREPVLKDIQPGTSTFHSTKTRDRSAGQHSVPIHDAQAMAACVDGAAYHPEFSHVPISTVPAYVRPVYAACPYSSTYAPPYASGNTILHQSIGQAQQYHPYSVVVPAFGPTGCRVLRSTQIPVISQTQPFLITPAEGIIPLGEGVAIPGTETATGEDQDSENIKKYYENVVKPHLDVRKREKNEKREELKDSEQSLENKKHICAGCGKVRSKGYHLTHPLKSGDVPEYEFCRKCVALAEFTDSDATESMSTNDTSDANAYDSSTCQFMTERRYKTSTRRVHTTSDEDGSVHDYSPYRSHQSRPRQRNMKSKHAEAVRGETPSALRKWPQRKTSLCFPEESSSQASSPPDGPHKRKLRAKNSNQAKIPRSPLFQASTDKEAMEVAENHRSRASSTFSTQHKAKPRADSIMPSYSLKSHLRGPSTTTQSRSTAVSLTQPIIGEESIEGSRVQNNATVSSSQRVELARKDDSSTDGDNFRSNEADFSEPEAFVTSSTKHWNDFNVTDSVLRPSNLQNAVSLSGYSPSLDTPHDTAFHAMPSTPSDIGFDDSTTHPHIRHDSWENDQSQLENYAEQLVEEELMRAGKRSGLFDRSCDNTAASTFTSTFNYRTPSIISIESCGSTEVRVDRNDHYRMSNDGAASESDDICDSDEYVGDEILDSHNRVRSTYEDRAIFSSHSDREPSMSYKTSTTTSPKKSDSATMSSANINAAIESAESNSSLVSNSSYNSFNPSHSVKGSSILGHTGYSTDTLPGSDIGIHASPRHPRRRIHRTNPF
ncbi:hypothetical protein BX600DRAFT_493880 [Xylariales sp. PMI_506]|nr:hypothetical protein BX600DRAFT_493880 [Xylariales sp. PMI_506]